MPTSMDVSGNPLNPFNTVQKSKTGDAAAVLATGFGTGFGTDYAGQFNQYLSGLKGATGMGYGDMSLPGLPNQDLTAQRGQIASGAGAAAKTAVGNLASRAGGDTSNPMFQYMASMSRAGAGAAGAASQVNLTNQTNNQNFQNQQSNYNLDLSRRTAANNAMAQQNSMTLGLGNLALGGGQLGLSQLKNANDFTLGQGNLAVNQGQLSLDQLKNKQAAAQQPISNQLSALQIGASSPHSPSGAAAYNLGGGAQQSVNPYGSWTAGVFNNPSPNYSWA